MIRILAVLLILFLLVGAIRKLTGTRDEPDKRPVAKLVKCDHCGVYISQATAISDGSAHYCSEQHRSEAGQS